MVSSAFMLGLLLGVFIAALFGVMAVVIDMTHRRIECERRLAQKREALWETAYASVILDVLNKKIAALTNEQRKTKR